MTDNRRFQNRHRGRPWPGTNPSLSELLSDNATFRDFAKAVEINAAYRDPESAFHRGIYVLSKAEILTSDTFKREHTTVRAAEDLQDLREMLR